MVVASRNRVRLLAELEELLGEAVRVNEALIEAAEVGRGTLLQAKLEQSQIAVAKRQAQIDLAARQQALAATLGVTPEWLDSIGDDPWPTAPKSLAHVDPSAAGDAAAPLAIASPELAVARAQWEAARCELSLAEVEIISNVSSQMSLQQDALSNDVIVGLQVGIALPITDRKRGLVQAARAQVVEQQAQYAALERQLMARWADARGQYERALELAATIESDLLHLAQERLDLARQAQQQGEIDYLELLTAQRSFLSIQQSALDTLEQAALAHVRLQTCAVEESP
jgi:cobalt-zinc-cadmium efflux system outer membrane protein